MKLFISQYSYLKFFFQSLDRDAFIMFPNIEEIILSNNRLGAIDWEAFRLYKLRRLILSYNSLTVKYFIFFAKKIFFYTLNFFKKSLSFAHRQSHKYRKY